MSFDAATKQIELELHNASRGVANFLLRAKNKTTDSYFIVCLNLLQTSVLRPQLR